MNTQLADVANCYIPQPTHMLMLLERHKLQAKLMERQCSVGVKSLDLLIVLRKLLLPSSTFTTSVIEPGTQSKMADTRRSQGFQVLLKEKHLRHPERRTINK